MDWASGKRYLGMIGTEKERAIGLLSNASGFLGWQVRGRRRGERDIAKGFGVFLENRYVRARTSTAEMKQRYFFKLRNDEMTNATLFRWSASM